VRGPRDVIERSVGQWNREIAALELNILPEKVD
jgi:hypothetical protein